MRRHEVQGDSYQRALNLFCSNYTDLETSGCSIWIRMQVTEHSERESTAIPSGPRHQRCPCLPLIFKQTLEAPLQIIITYLMSVFGMAQKSKSPKSSSDLMERQKSDMCFPWVVQLFLIFPPRIHNTFLPSCAHSLRKWCLNAQLNH